MIFESTDFVQVEKCLKFEGGEPITVWRNALYVMEQDSNHVVIYTDGTKEVLNRATKIRKVRLNSQ